MNSLFSFRYFISFNSIKFDFCMMKSYEIVHHETPCTVRTFFANYSNFLLLGQRRAFLDTRDCIAARLDMEDENEKLVSKIYLSISFLYLFSYLSLCFILANYLISIFLAISLFLIFLAISLFAFFQANSLLFIFLAYYLLNTRDCITASLDIYIYLILGC